MGRDRIGAVMVVGGGIGGIQAALDLADFVRYALSTGADLVGAQPSFFKNMAV